MAITKNGCKYNVRLDDKEDKRLHDLMQRWDVRRKAEGRYWAAPVGISDVFRAGLLALEREYDEEDRQRVEKEAAAVASNVAAAKAAKPKPAKKGKR